MLINSIHTLSKSTSSRQSKPVAYPQRKSVEVSVKSQNGGQETVHVDAYGERVNTSVDTESITRIDD